MEYTIFDRFIALINFDKVLYDIEQEIKVLNMHILNLSSEFEIKQDLHVQCSKRLQSAREAVDDSEKLLAQFQLQEKLLQQKIMLIHDKIEYRLLKKEIEYIKNQQYEYEDYILSVWQTYESVQKEYQKNELEYAVIEHKYDGEYAACIAKIDALRIKLLMHNSDRVLLMHDIPEGWLVKYERMKNIVSDPVVLLQDNFCSSCFFLVSNSDKIRINNHNFVECHGCYRLLYTVIKG